MGIFALLPLPGLRIPLSSFCPFYIWQVCFQQIWQALVGVTGPVPHFHTWLAPSSLAWTNVSNGGRTTEHDEVFYIKHALAGLLCLSDSYRKLKKIQFELQKAGLNLLPLLLFLTFFFCFSPLPIAKLKGDNKMEELLLYTSMCFLVAVPYWVSST